MWENCWHTKFFGQACIVLAINTFESTPELDICKQAKMLKSFVRKSKTYAEALVLTAPKDATEETQEVLEGVEHLVTIQDQCFHGLLLVGQACPVSCKTKLMMMMNKI
ncbi:hypothetical protein HanPSC8_Chr16g0729871 [Helianthus annuus]|nr:hypothetical protein HanPSC8_Chr16g0729871 [Helianthus annuus]